MRRCQACFFPDSHPTCVVSNPSSTFNLFSFFLKTCDVSTPPPEVVPLVKSTSSRPGQNPDQVGLGWPDLTRPVDPVWSDQFMFHRSKWLNRFNQFGLVFQVQNGPIRPNPVDLIWYGSWVRSESIHGRVSLYRILQFGAKLSPTSNVDYEICDVNGNPRKYQTKGIDPAKKSMTGQSDLSI